MSVKVNAFDNTPFDQRSIFSMGDRFITQLLRLVFSGTYITGGDTLDFTNVGGTPTYPNAVPPAASSAPVGPSSITVCDNDPIAAPGASVAADYDYRFIAGATPDTWKVVIFTGAGVELENGIPYGGDFDCLIVTHWSR